MKIHSFLHHLRAAAPLTLLIGSAVNAQGDADAAARARTAIVAAAKAIGGASGLEALKSSEREGVDEWVDTLQQKRPWVGPIVVNKLPVGERIALRLYVDYKNHAFAKVQRFDDGPGDQFTQVDTGTEEGGMSKGQFHTEPYFYSTSSADDAASARAQELKRLPEALVHFALEHPEATSWAGSRIEHGRSYDVVKIGDPKLGDNELYIDRATHLPAKVQFPRDHPILGDTMTATVFSDYRRTGGVTLPYRTMYEIGGVPTHIISWSNIRVGASAPADLFTPPVTYVKTVNSPDKPELRDLGGGIYAVLGSYNVMFAVFDDQVLLTEAPMSADYTLQILDIIARVAPGKKIVSVASHFHADHVAGARALVAKGIPIIAMPDTRDIIRLAAAAHKTIKPDILSQHPAQPIFIDAKADMAFSDAHQSARIIDVGPTAHSDHLLATYFPNARAIAVADLWDVPAPEQAIGGNDAALFWDKIKAAGLDVELMVPVHGNPVTRAQMERGLAIRAKYLPGPTR